MKNQLKTCLALAAISCLCACFGGQSDRAASAASPGELPAELHGHWVSMEWLDAIASFKSPRRVSVFPPFSELALGSYHDSVLVVAGQSDAALIPAKFSGDTLWLAGVFGEKSRTCCLPDTAGTNLLTCTDPNGKNWVFLRAKDSYQPMQEGNAPAFSQALNEALVAGKYARLDGSGKPTSDTVVFLVNGEVKGFSGGFTNYDICYSGGCTGMTDDADLVTFMKKAGQTEDYGFTIEQDAEGGTTLTLLNLKNTAQDGEIPRYKSGGVHMKLAKLPSAD